MRQISLSVAAAIFSFFIAVIVLPAPLLAGELLTTHAKTQAFLKELKKARTEVDQRIGESAARLKGAMATIRATKKRHDKSKSNVERLNLAVTTLCDSDVSVAILLSDPKLKIQTARAHFKNWARNVDVKLSKDPIENAYLWYQRYDFREPLKTYNSLENSLAREFPRAVARICSDLKNTALKDLHKIAAQLDAINKEGQRTVAKLNAGGLSDAARDNLKKRLSDLSRQASQLDREHNHLLQQGQSRKSRAMQKLRTEIQIQTAHLEELKIPERGRITDQRPKQIGFANHTRFGVHFLGHGIPIGLTTADIGLPEGLRLLTLSGGGKDLYLYLEKTDALQPGEHVIDIAGEKVTFRFENQPGDTAATDEPLVSGNVTKPNIPSSEGQIPEDGKGTLLTPQVLTDYPQLQWGYWQYKKEYREKGDTEKDFNSEVCPISGH